MVITAAFGWGGAALGAIDIQIAKSWTSNAAAGQFRRGFKPSRSLQILIRCDDFVARIALQLSQTLIPKHPRHAFTNLHFVARTFHRMVGQGRPERVSV